MHTPDASKWNPAQHLKKSGRHVLINTNNELPGYKNGLFFKQTFTNLNIGFSKYTNFQIFHQNHTSVSYIHVLSKPL